jgi:hypothetical protein
LIGNLMPVRGPEVGAELRPAEVVVGMADDELVKPPLRPELELNVELDVVAGGTLNVLVSIRFGPRSYKVKRM